MGDADSLSPSRKRPRTNSFETNSDKLELFTAWCRNVPIDLSKIRFEQTADRGLSVVATVAIAADEPTLSVPIRAVFSVATAVRSKIGQAVLSSQTAGGKPVSARAIMMVAMIDGRARSDSFWHAFFNVMPERYEDPLWWAPETREQLLVGTQLLHDAARHERVLRQTYDEFFPALTLENPELFPAKRFTLDAFRWARSALSSRCLSDTAFKASLSGPSISSGGESNGDEIGHVQLTAVESARLVHDCEAFLCPVLDMTNHNHSTFVKMGLFVSDGSKHVGLHVEGGVAQGAEVFNNYGKCRTNLQFLLGYGFCMPENSADTVPLQLGVGMASGAPEGSVKRQALELSGLRLEEVHDLSRSQPLPPRILATLRILLADNGCVRKLLSTGSAESLLAALQDAMPPSPSDPDCELRALSVLGGQLFKMRDALGEMQNSGSGQVAERYVALYREGQKAVLSSAIKAVGDAQQSWADRHGVALPGDDSSEEGEEEGEEEEDGEKEVEED
eukprot:TRINITY_DN76992_c0_g1_i1.p1 TRINITY_DN76992_c0_g1~~TRINITY_DN76992_c0_g1_i1.p1  ORF type:complete len:505 (+),score=72.50 TRINITY_DN76992_c0_g1_i1:108-1622(+)